MTIQEARDVARQWVMEEAGSVPGFRGAFYHGSTNWLPDDAVLSTTSDVDVMVVLADPDPPVKPGKFRYRGVLLELSYLSEAELQSAEMILGRSDLAGSFRAPGVISDPSGRLSQLQAAVSREYARRAWVSRRCEHAVEKVLRNLRSLGEAEAFHDQVLCWLFAVGVTTHVLLVAGLKNPTVRRRYVATRELLAEYGRSEFYEALLELLGCHRMSRPRAQVHLAALAEVFDAAKAMVGTPFPFASDISEAARPIAIDGSREMIEQGDHREAVFWIAVTYSRCRKILSHDAPVEVRDQFSPGYRQLLGDLGIASSADLRRRGEQVRGFLPRIREVAEALMKANPAIEG